MAKHTLGDLADLGKLFSEGAYEAPQESPDTIPEAKTDRALRLAKLLIQLEKKGRKGKGVTVVKGFFHTTADLEQFARELKTRCGSGGTVKNDTIEIQGDHRETVASYFKAKGFKGNF
ncbi:MAG: translation initiation factor [Bacteroidia bacterium]|nr:translation initiation factor [Bacteroidia bacterium]